MKICNYDCEFGLDYSRTSVWKIIHSSGLSRRRRVMNPEYPGYEPPQKPLDEYSGLDTVAYCGEQPGCRML